MCFGPNRIAVQSWEVCELEFDFIDCGPLLLAMENFVTKDKPNFKLQSFSLYCQDKSTCVRIYSI